MIGIKCKCTMIFVLLIGFLCTPGISTATPAKSVDELIKDIQSVFLEKDVEGLMKLYYQGGNISNRFVENHLVAWRKSIAQSKLLAVETRPLPSGFNAERVMDGIRYSLNVDVLGFIELKLNNKEWGEELQHVPYGKAEEGYYLANVVEEQLQGSESSDSEYSIVMSGGVGVSFEGFCHFIASGTEQQVKFSAEVSNKSTNSSQARSIEAKVIKQCQMTKIKGENEISLRIEKITSTDPLRSETIFFEEASSDRIQYSSPSQ